MTLLAEILTEVRALAEADRRHWLPADLTAALAGALLSFVDGYVWRPSEAYVVVMTLTAADFLTGLWLAAQNRRLDTRKLLRLPLRLLAYTAMLAFAFNLARHDALLGWLPEAVFFPMALALLASFAKNLSLLGLAPAWLARALYERLDAWKNRLPDLPPPPDAPAATSDPRAQPQPDERP